MKVLLLLGLIVATVWAYPVADSEVSTSTVVVDYSAVAKDTSASHEHVHQDSAESSESHESSEEKIEEPKTEAVKGEPKPLADEVKPNSSEESKESLPIEEVKEVKAELPVQDEVVATLPEAPLVPEVAKVDDVKAPETPLEEPVEVPEAPVALPTVNADATERKTEDEPLKLEETKVESEIAPAAPTIEEEIKVEASEVKLVEEPKAVVPKEATDELILPILPEAPVLQDPIPEVPQVLPQELVVPAADPVADVEKKDRKEDAPVEAAAQQDPIDVPIPEVAAELPLPLAEVKEELPIPLPAADLPAEPLPSVTVPLPAVPAVIATIDAQPIALEEPQQVPIAEVVVSAVPELPEPLIPAQPILAVQEEQPLADPLPAPVDPIPQPEQNQVVLDKEVPEVQVVQESKPAEVQLQEVVPAPAAPAAIIPEAPTFLPTEVLATPVEPEPVKVEEAPAPAPVVEPQPIQPEVPKDLIPEIH